MNKRFILIHPISVLVLSIAAVGISLFLYIRWYLQANDRLIEYAQKLRIAPSDIVNSVQVIVVSSTLLGVILLGIAIIFIYYQKTISLVRMQDNFINNFTHELKTPLASISLHLETLLKHEIPEKQRRLFVETMVKDTGRLTSNVNQILELAKLENLGHRSQREQLYPKETKDLVAFVQHFIKFNEHLFSNTQFTVTNYLDFHPVYAINPPMMEMLLMNLFNNSIKYFTPTATDPFPRIDIHFRIENYRSLCIDIQDNGIGIPEKFRKNVFKKFFRIDADPGGKQGTGLGLYLCAQIMKIHKAKISIIDTSQANPQGTCVQLKIPYWVSK